MTIFALSSGMGRAGVAVIRVSGPQTRAALAKLVDGAFPEPRMAAFRTLRNPASREVLDRALVFWFPAPASFTGEDVAELHVHGGRAVVAAMFEALSALGLRMAEPGEFTRRAFENGKLDLTEAEGLADLINAETGAQRRQALAQTSGALRTHYESWRASLLRAMALVESSLDFADEADVAENAIQLAIPEVRKLKADVERALDDGRRGEIVRNGVQVAIIGAPNVGKSSLLNALAGREAAIVFDEPGTTRDVIEVALDLDGYPFVFRDTAGLRDAENAIEREGIRRTRAAAAAADLVLFITDVLTPHPVLLPLGEGTPLRDLDLLPLPITPSWPDLIRPSSATDRDLRLDMDGRVKPGHDAIILFNKIDLAPSALTPESALRISAKTGEGLDALKARLVDFAKANFGAAETPLITRARHRQELEAARTALQTFLDGTEAALPAELLAEHLREAATALGRLTGRVDVEDVLGQIFADFCIGK